ncbi:MAG: hypothetical protein K6U80_04455 [Firmicutes bacterium]|nr:hypothetical protein [Bacillota bacterium]
MIDWEKYQKDPCQNGQPVTEPGRVWRDSWSGIEFGLEQSQWERIEEQGRARISNLIKQNKKEELFTYLAGKQTGNLPISDDASLYPFLPLLEPGDRLSKELSASRRCDVLSLRAALCYALAPKTGFKKEKLREWAILSMPWLQKILPSNYLEEVPGEIKRLLADIDRFLKGEAVGEGYELSLVKGGSFRVKNYLWETVTLPGIRGASCLLDEINRIEIPKWAEEHAIPESLIFAGGGKCLLILPKWQGKECVLAIEDLYFQNTWTADNAAVEYEVDLKRLANDYQNAMEELDDCLLQWQMLKLPPLHPPDSALQFDEFQKLEEEGEEKVCTCCQLRPALWKERLNPEGNDAYLCWSCARRTREGKQKKVSFRKEVYDYYSAMNRKVKEDAGDIQSTVDLKDHNNSIGVIDGDANHMGQYVYAIKSLTALRAFSMETERVVKLAVYGALLNCKADDTLDKFEIIAIGGDDVFLIVPGDEALKIAREIGTRFEAAYQGADKSSSRLTMSIGVTLSSYRMPIRFLFETAGQLLKSAKKKAKVKKEGMLDVLSLLGDASLGTTVSDVRKRQNEGPIRRTVRPYTWTNVQSLLVLIEYLRKQNLGNRVISLAQAIDKSSTPLEAELYYAYLLSRMAEGKEQASIDALNSVTQTLAGPEWLNLSDTLESPRLFAKDDRGKEPVYYSLWHDIAELWDAAGG